MLYRIMFKKQILISIFLFTIFTFFGDEKSNPVLPYPDNGQLYTEFISYREASYLKKPLISNGIIVMDGEENFIFQQNNPVFYKIRKKADKITYQKKDGNIISIDKIANDIYFLFQNKSLDNTDFDVSKKSLNSITYYYVKPKKLVKIDEIIIKAQDDKVLEILINFKDKSILKYTFQNTVTGVKPDENYFK